MSKKNEYFQETKEESKEILNELFYNCDECSSPIEILSIKNNILEFKCVNNHNKNILIEEYINKMKENYNNDANNDICINHNKKYECYCKDCNMHLCKECLKLRNHFNHSKNYIIEVQPNKKELNIFYDIIHYYNDEIDKLEKEKLYITNKLNKKKEENKKKFIDRNQRIKLDNETKIKNELKLNYEKYMNKIEILRNNYEKEIKLLLYNYKIKQNEIINKYKFIYEYNNILYNNKKEILEKKYINLIQKNDYTKKIENINNIKRLNEIIYSNYIL